MDFWTASQTGTRANKLAEVIASIGAPSFFDRIHSFCYSKFRPDCVSIFDYESGSEIRRLALPETNGFKFTLQCWELYASAVPERDSLWAMARQALSCGADFAYSYVRANSSPYPSPSMRSVYRSFGVRSRLSVFHIRGTGGMAQFNIYRLNTNPDFSASDIESWTEYAPMLLVAALKHDQINSENISTGCSDLLIGRRLSEMCPSLSRREVQVCSRALLGRSYKAIARELGISPTTAKTYRERAYTRLGIVSREDGLTRVLAN